MQRREAREVAVSAARIILLVLCLYGVSPLSTHPGQRVHRHAYTSHTYAFFSNFTLGFVIISCIIGYVYRGSGCKSTLFSLYNLVLPVSSAMSTMVNSGYWPAFFYDRRLVMSKRHLENGCETYLFTNLCVHLFPLLLSLVELSDIRLAYSTWHVPGLCGVLLLYFSIVLYCHQKLDRFPYPFMKDFTNFHLFATFLLLGLSGILVLKAVLWLNERLSGGSENSKGEDTVFNRATAIYE